MDEDDLMHGASALDIMPNDAPDGASVRLVLAGIGLIAVFALAMSAVV